MTQIVSENRFLQGGYAPIDQEYSVNPVSIQGEVPRDLNGSLYRNGPNQRFEPIGDYHLFAGDGMTHAFHISDGQIEYRNRWIQTAKYKIETEKGKAVIDPMNPMGSAEEYVEFVLTDREGLANTASVWHGGKLLILEEAHLPFEVDPVTLESIGSYNFDEKLPRSMTAHPKIDPKTGEMVFFAYMASDIMASDFAVYRVDAQGRLIESITVSTPYPAMIHDFAVTENYILVPVFPLVGSMERAMVGESPLAWEPDKGASVAVLPRSGWTQDKVRWAQCDPFFVFHYMNAFDDNGKITVDGCQFDHAPLFPSASGEEMPDSTPVLHRWSLDMNSSSPAVKSNRIDQENSEFPQVDPRYAGMQYRYGFYTSPEGDGDDMYNVVARFDHQTGQAERYCFGPRDQVFVSEALFVPKSETASEGEGYLLSVVTDMNEKSSALHIMDAENVGAGPLAVAQLQHRIPVGFHGSWRPA